MVVKKKKTDLETLVEAIVKEQLETIIERVVKSTINALEERHKNKANPFSV